MVFRTLHQLDRSAGDGWWHISVGKDTLITAPTGSGKTLTAFLWSIDHLVRRSATGDFGDRTSVVYISPFKALGNDIQKNLLEPLADIMRLAQGGGDCFPEIRVAVRSGDPPARERQLMVHRPPHIPITTPESFYILLTAARSRQILKRAKTIIVDGIRAVAGDKRGVHLALRCSGFSGAWKHGAKFASAALPTASSENNTRCPRP